MIDSHCHLDFPVFDHDRDAVIARSQALGVRKMIIAGISRQYWSRLWNTVESNDSLYAALGLHPYFLIEHQSQDLQELRKYLTQYKDHPKLCAIGEIGLDFFLKNLDRTQQVYLFEQQLQFATEFNLPVIIHSRRANAQITASLKQAQLPRAGIIHAFSGSYEEAMEYIKLGFLLGFGGAATWPRATRLQNVLKRLPLEHIVLETDSPDMPPYWLLGSRNSPEHLPRICQHLADIIGISSSALANQTTNNLQQLFGWKN
ncbi:TatD family hydrolase [Denitrificimonas sp. JX-1]|mgnify:CR=1 FL=1|uniref:TatD family hydrolase n=1 Tax=Denitrificimonas halotolerans TaxID=3098930 RepID=A0ABU5GSC9_9GAMM|nr:TatD family hydrolase [Denitrificimonas sp. JX-1]MDY7219779.1 TatD family hydrolase [Denitrificimonas sp. JX-1]